MFKVWLPPRPSHRPSSAPHAMRPRPFCCRRFGGRLSNAASIRVTEVHTRAVEFGPVRENSVEWRYQRHGKDQSKVTFGEGLEAANHVECCDFHGALQIRDARRCLLTTECVNQGRKHGRINACGCCAPDAQQHRGPRRNCSKRAAAGPNLSGCESNSVAVKPLRSNCGALRELAFMHILELTPSKAILNFARTNQPL
jgi:hypothetical protein